MRKAAKRDKNEKPIIQAMQAIGANVLQINQEDTFDLLAFYCGKTFIIEVKNPEYRPKKKSVDTMLTEGEARCKLLAESCKVKYHIVFDPDEAIQILLNGTGRKIGGTF